MNEDDFVPKKKEKKTEFNVVSNYVSPDFAQKYMASWVCDFLYYILLFCIIFKIVNIERTYFFEIMFCGLENLRQNKKKC